MYTHTCIYIYIHIHIDIQIILQQLTWLERLTIAHAFSQSAGCILNTLAYGRVSCVCFLRHIVSANPNPHWEKEPTLNFQDQTSRFPHSFFDLEGFLIRGCVCFQALF